MLKVISYFVIALLVLLVILYFYIETQKKRAIEENKKAILLRVASMKDNYKLNLKRLVEQQTLSIAEYESLYRIANNFFVFQKVTPQSIAYGEQLLESVINAMPIGGPDTANFETVHQQVTLFIKTLPTAVGDYNSTFYNNVLPELVKNLVAFQENSYEITQMVESSAENIIDNEQSQNSLGAITSQTNN
ncbi:hypothetical protein GCM10007916_22550 [Psychromonas marina]|uniref:LemA family protein n=1 Tax=Psychromonas marina TaxID=88364 RepID=A0ABQ6E2H8_9GAMM|nr:hypothetical protein [Psychromonas marina]GLS91186.1 hypothetical protein GCM10007916_22550 [Psychromonas marina]